jgi:hypothetical protein
MDKDLRRRRAARAAVELLDWRDSKAKEEARDRAARETAEQERALRYLSMIAELRTQLDEFSRRATSRTTCKTIKANFRGDGGVGVLEG